jgi:hypothetical protein
MFSLIPWTGPLNGFEFSSTIDKLAIYLGPEWLFDDNLDHLIEDLIHRISKEKDIIEKIQLQKLAFSNTLLDRYKRSNSDTSSLLLNRLGQELSTLRCHIIGGFTHVRINH